jgi:23S rRNA (cytidine1920-2'-O)/16S rRNA (cytidine1409-2'-O)-methyltransferase
MRRPYSARRQPLSLTLALRRDTPMKNKSSRKRLDQLLVERGLAESSAKAQAMILAGEVHVGGQRAGKPGDQISESSRIEVVSRGLKYVSRGGLKLEGALEDFSIDPVNRTCLDIGSSTGGFTDCLLQHGAKRVFAIDVNTDQLAWKLHKDTRVVQIKRNARELSQADLEADESITLCVADVSFISATKILSNAAALLNPGSDALILVKPQFELPREDVAKGGVVTDVQLHQKAIEKVRAALAGAQLEFVAVRPSRLPGAEGNQEYFLHARKIH